jgi:hypothetical protein
MKRILLLCSMLIAVTGFAQITAVTINEVNADNPGGGGPGGGRNNNNRNFKKRF